MQPRLPLSAGCAKDATAGTPHPQHAQPICHARQPCGNSKAVLRNVVVWLSKAEPRSSAPQIKPPHSLCDGHARDPRGCHKRTVCKGETVMLHGTNRLRRPHHVLETPECKLHPGRVATGRNCIAVRNHRQLSNLTGVQIDTAHQTMQRTGQPNKPLTNRGEVAASGNIGGRRAR